MGTLQCKTQWAGNPSYQKWVRELPTQFAPIARTQDQTCTVWREETWTHGVLTPSPPKWHMDILVVWNLPARAEQMWDSQRTSSLIHALQQACGAAHVTTPNGPTCAKIHAWGSDIGKYDCTNRPALPVQLQYICDGIIKKAPRKFTEATADHVEQQQPTNTATALMGGK